MDELISTIIIPTERPPLSLDVKRALLTFDQVHLSAPDDRELINPIAFMSATVPMPIPIALGTVRSVLPLGKLPRYDDVFEDTIRECDAAALQGSVVVQKTPQIADAGLVIGAVQTPPGWPHPNWVMHTFRNLVSQRDVLFATCRGLPSEADLRRLDLDLLAPGGAALNEGWGGPPKVANLEDASLSADVGIAVQRLAATRLGSAIKYIGVSEVMGLHPTSNDHGMVALLEHFQKASGASLASILDRHSDRDVVARAMRVERIVIGHDFPDAVLAKLSVADVLKLRTKAWGRAGAARTAFFAAVRQIADEHPSEADFDRAVREEIEKYRGARAELTDEWAKLGVKVGLPTVAGVAAGNVLQSVLGIPSWSVALGLTALGSALAGVADEVVKIFRVSRNIKAGPGKALVSPYAFALRDLG